MLKILPAVTLALILPAKADSCPEPATLDAAYTQTGLQGFNNGLLAVKKDGLWGFVNRKGRLAIPARFEETQGFSESKAAVKLNGIWGIIDSNGKILVQPRYQNARRYFSGLLPVSKNGKDYLALDHHGRETELPRWDVRPDTPLHKFHTEDFSKIGYKDHNGNIVVAALYERGVNHFSEGMAAVRKNGLWGFIDAEGNESIAPRYTLPQGQWDISFSDGLAKVALDGKIAFIDKQGCTILQQK